jgi:glycine cleavage system transcriptional repressor
MSDRQQLIMTAIGPDQVGLVEKISEFISQRGGNIDDSKMAVFCGEFAVIILIGGDETSIARISSDYREIEKETGLITGIRTPLARRSAGFLPYRLTASCMDHPGVVYQISGVLRGMGVNIESMETKTYSAPVSGTPLFQLEAELAVPTATNINQLRERLEYLQAEENIDIEIAPSFQMP